MLARSREASPLSSGVAADRATNNGGGIARPAVRHPGDELVGPHQDQRRLVEFPQIRAVVADQLERHSPRLAGANDLGASALRRAEIEQGKAGSQFLEDIAARRELPWR